MRSLSLVFLLLFVLSLPGAGHFLPPVAITAFPTRSLAGTAVAITAPVLPPVTVTALAFSPDGDVLASGTLGEGAVNLWDVTTGQKVRTFEGHGGGINALAFSPDGRCLLTGSTDGTARIWDVASGKTTRILRDHKDGVTMVAWSPNGLRAATGTWKGVARVWDAATGTVVRTLRDTNITGMRNVGAFSREGRYLITGTKRWDLTTGGVVCRYPGERQSVSPDGQRVLSEGSKGEMVQDAETGKTLCFTGDFGHQAAAFSPDDRELVVGGWNGAAVKSAATGELLHNLGEHLSDPIGVIFAATFSPDGQTVATGGADGTIRLWVAATGAPIQTIDGDLGPTVAGAFSPDGKSMATVDWDGTIRFRDAATGAILRVADRLRGTGVSKIQFSPDGQYLLVESANFETARVLSVATGQELHSFDYTVAANTGLQDATFSPDNRLLIFGCVGMGVKGVVRGITVWEVITGHRLHTLLSSSGTVSAVAFTPDGSHVLAAGTIDPLPGSGYRQEIVQLWDTQTGRLIQTLPPPVAKPAQHLAAVKLPLVRHRRSGRRRAKIVMGTPIAIPMPILLPDPFVNDAWWNNNDIPTGVFSPDSRRLMKCDGYRVQVSEAANSKPVRVFQIPSLSAPGTDGTMGAPNFRTMTFSPHGDQIAIGDTNGIAALYDLATGKRLRTFSPGAGAVTTATFSPDGHHLLFCSIFGPATVWDTATGQRVLTLTGTGQPVRYPDYR